MNNYSAYKCSLIKNSFCVSSLLFSSAGDRSTIDNCTYPPQKQRERGSVLSTHSCGTRFFILEILVLTAIFDIGINRPIKLITIDK